MKTTLVKWDDPQTAENEKKVKEKYYSGMIKNSISVREYKDTVLNMPNNEPCKCDEPVVKLTKRGDECLRCGELIYS